MNVPTPMNDNARDDRFNRGLDRLLEGDPTGIDEIDPELQDVAIQMVQLANDAGWIGSDPGEEPIRPRQWWRNGKVIVNAIAAVLVIGLVASLISVGLQVWGPGNNQHGSAPTPDQGIMDRPGVCGRTPLTDAEIAAIVRKSEAEVEPFRQDGAVEQNVTVGALQLLRDWNTCLQQQNWRGAMAYESEFFIWQIGQEEFSEGTAGFTDAQIANKIAERHRVISTVNTTDGLNLAIYSAEKFRMNPEIDVPAVRGADVWLAPVDQNGDWIEWPSVVTVEWDGTQWMMVSINRDGVPDSDYFRHDALPATIVPDSQ